VGAAVCTVDWPSTCPIPAHLCACGRFLAPRCSSSSSSCSCWSNSSSLESTEDGSAPEDVDISIVLQGFRPDLALIATTGALFGRPGARRRRCRCARGGCRRPRGRWSSSWRTSWLFSPSLSSSERRQLLLSAQTEFPKRQLANINRGTKANKKCLFSFDCN